MSPIFPTNQNQSTLIGPDYTFLTLFSILVALWFSSSSFVQTWHSLAFLCFILIPCGKCESPYVGKAAAAARATLYPFPPACAVFSCVQTMVWLPVSEIFNADVDARDLHTGAVGRTP